MANVTFTPELASDSFAPTTQFYIYGTLALASLFFFSQLIFGAQYPKKSGCKPPPGPSGIPIMGNAFQFDAAMPCIQFKKWAEEYGSLFYLKVGGDRLFVINSSRLIKEAMDKRSGIYSDRRSPHVAQTVMSKGKRMVFSRYDNRWRAARKQAHGFLAAKAVEGLGRKWQELESIQMVHELLHQDPHNKKENFYHSFRRYASSVIVNLSFGHRFPRAAGDELLEGIYEAMENVAKVSQPGTYLVDSFPFLQKITPPFLRTWDREGERMHEEEWKVWGGHLYRLKDEYKAGTAKECFIGELLAEREGMSQAEQEEKALTDYDLGYQICGFLEAGSDTTASALASCVLALIQFPDVLRRAHEELDRVVGQDRMPTWEDEPKLQYIRGIAKEVLRWRPPVIMAVPHATSKDDILDGYFIPEGSMVIGNTWAISHDPERYPDPDKFDPDRFVNHTKGAFQSSLEANPLDRDHFAYGFGRRLCVGVHLAEQSLFITISRMLWAFSVKQAKDPKTGSLVPVDSAIETGYQRGFVTAPHWFPAEFVVRSEAKRKIVEHEFQAAQEQFRSEGRET